MKFTRKEIIYPIFIKVSQLCKDAFWMYLYDDLAYGVCPYGSYIDTNTMSIISRLKGKQFNFVFVNQDPQYIYITLTELFSSKLNLYSKVEFLHQRAEFNTFLNLSYNAWKDIKKTNIKNILLQNFILRLKKQYHFTISQSKKILSIVNMAFLFKLITPTDIVYDSEKCVITDICGLDFNHILERSIKIPIKPTVQTNQNSSIRKNGIQDVWAKFNVVSQKK